MRKTLVGLSTVAFFALFGLLSAAEASHLWGGYHWARTANPFTVVVGDNVSTVWDPYLDEAIADWSASSVLNLSKVPSSKSKSCVPTAGRIDVCSAKYGSVGWLGIAQIWVSGDHITKATTKLNDTYFARATYNTPAYRRLVTCQEIAHDLGLDHQDEVFDNVNLGTCMDYTNDPDGGAGGASTTDLGNEHPNTHDFEQLESLYAHVDILTTIVSQSTAPTARQDVTDNPATWGRTLRTSKDGRVSVHERDLGLGEKVITHVLWADGHDHHEEVSNPRARLR